MSYSYSQKKKIMRRLNKFFRTKFGLAWRYERDRAIRNAIQTISFSEAITKVKYVGLNSWENDNLLMKMIVDSK